MQGWSDLLAMTAALFDNAGRVAVALGALVTAILGLVAYRARKEPPPPGTPDALVMALGGLTKVMEAQGGNYAENMRLFEAANDLIGDLIEQGKEQRRILEGVREHLSAIRDAINRQR